MLIIIVAEEASKLFAYKRANVEATKEYRKRIRAYAIRKWQERWSAPGKGRWTYCLIPEIALLLNRAHSEVNNHVTQFLIGHGRCSYLHLSHKASPYCSPCNTEEVSEHAMFQ